MDARIQPIHLLILAAILTGVAYLLSISPQETMGETNETMGETNGTNETMGETNGTNGTNGTSAGLDANEPRGGPSDGAAPARYIARSPEVVWEAARECVEDALGEYRRATFEYSPDEPQPASMAVRRLSSGLYHVAGWVDVTDDEGTRRLDFVCSIGFESEEVWGCRSVDLFAAEDLL